MGDRAPRSLCLGGELLIPLRGAASRSPTVDQHQAPLGSNKLYLNSLLNGLAYYLRLPSPPPSTGGPPCTGPPLWTTLILPLTNRFQPQRGHIAHRPHDFLLGIRSAAGNDSHLRPPGGLPRRQLEQAQSFQPPQSADAGSLLVATGGRHPLQMLADRVDQLGPGQAARLDRFLNVLDFLCGESAPGQTFRCSVSDQHAAHHPVARSIISKPFLPVHSYFATK